MNYHAIWKRLPVLLLTLAVVVGGALMLGAQSASATHVEPTTVPGNPTCGDLAGTDQVWTELRVDPGEAGTYTDGTLSVTVDVRDTDDGPVFDWESNIGVDAVFSKGGPIGGNLYLYDPPEEETSDTGLHSPVNPQNNKFSGLSHILFCYDVELEVEKTAETSFTRTFEWEVDKSVNPATWDLFAGDSGTSDYTVVVTKTGFTDSDWAVDGTITIHNPSASVAATITGVTDEISGVGAVDVDCGVTFPHSLAADGTLECTYSAGLPDGDDRVNTATVTTTGAIGGGSATADVVFGDPTTLVDDNVILDDTFADGPQDQLVGDDETVEYSRTFECNSDDGQHDNTATITGEDSGDVLDSDDASVVVNCYELAVSKDAATSHNRTVTYDWTIEKVADQSELTLEIGEPFLVNYDVTVNAAVLSDELSGFAVSGNIVISNPAPIDAELTAVSDVVSPDIAAAVDCPSLTVPAGGTLTCTYSAALPDASERLNTATATQQNFDYASDGSALPSGTTDYSGSADVVFGDPTTTEEIDECADVSDTNVGFLGNLCVGDAPFTFEYSIDVGSRAECGDFTIDNTATVVAVDTGTADSADESVVVHVPCEVFEGCTPGFWKNNLTKKGGSQWPINPNTVTPFSSLTFAEAIRQTGGNVIYAHAAAALLNLYAGLNYPYSEQEIIDLFNAGDLGALAAANEAGCPLSQS